MHQGSDDNQQPPQAPGDKPKPAFKRKPIGRLCHRLTLDSIIMIGDAKIEVSKITNGMARITIEAPHSMRILFLKKPRSNPQ